MILLYHHYQNLAILLQKKVVHQELENHLVQIDYLFQVYQHIQVHHHVHQIQHTNQMLHLHHMQLIIFPFHRNMHLSLIHISEPTRPY